MRYCGIDEAGRGPLAGPVCAAAVILPENFPREILGDSKKLSPREREGAMSVIYRGAFAWGIGWASAFEIDRINILKASLLAMKRAFEELAAASAGDLPPGITAIVDGLYVPDIPIPCRALVKADAQVPEVMAASILAKTARDRMMERYSWLYPDYGYDRHKGYPTQDHLKKIALHGPSPIQRRSFRVKPIQLPLFNPPGDGRP
ncbi:MAG: ribonuclease HII [Spirochaetaceae bacterium]|jgi:ribonuclease HII|nr:ribonuclease HII [Spirochaetaceae bacterium]